MGRDPMTPNADGNGQDFVRHESATLKNVSTGEFSGSEVTGQRERGDRGGMD